MSSLLIANIDFWFKVKKKSDNYIFIQLEISCCN